VIRPGDRVRGHHVAHGLLGTVLAIHVAGTAPGEWMAWVRWDGQTTRISYMTSALYIDHDATLAGLDQIWEAL
jgi:hypothetical protein